MTDRHPQPSLDRLIVRLSRLIGAATDALERDPAQVNAWEDEVARELRRYTAAAYLSGAGVDTPGRAAEQKIAADLRAQLKFLGQFKVEIQDAEAWQNGWNARAQMYAQSIKTPYWRGKTKMLPLPAMPGDGTTECLTRCKCAWDVQELEGDGNYDAYWIYGATEHHCQGCIERAQQWAPLRIRDGELQ